MHNPAESNAPAEEGNPIKRLFWPSYNPIDADLLGQQGFWICLAVGLLALVGAVIQGHWIIGLIAFSFFFLGGIGVREHSFIAALLVAPAYVLSILAGALAGQLPGFLSAVAAILLLANIRGTWVAARLQREMKPEDFPLRFNEDWKDKLVDQLPAFLWPKTRILFYVVSLLYVGLIGLGIAVTLNKHSLER